MQKQELTKQLKSYFKEVLQAKYADNYAIELLIPDKQISKINNEKIKKFDGYSSLDFSPHILTILEDHETSEIELIFINRTNKSISLKEVGELFCYSKLAQVKRSFLISSKGVSNEVNILLLDNNIKNRLLTLENGNRITIGSWSQNHKNIKPDSIIPLEEKEFFS